MTALPGKLPIITSGTLSSRAVAISFIMEAVS